MHNKLKTIEQNLNIYEYCNCWLRYQGKRYRELKGTKYKIFTVDLYDKSADFQK